MTKLKEKPQKKTKGKNNKKSVKLNKIKQNITQVILLSLIIFAVIFCIYQIIRLAMNPTDSFLVEQGQISQKESLIGYVIRNEVTSGLSECSPGVKDLTRSSNVDMIISSEFYISYIQAYRQRFQIST